MARVTIVPEDSMVLVDGVSRDGPIDMTGIDPAIHAVQWDGTAGEIEFTRVDGRGNEQITDISPFQVFIDRWTAAAPPLPGPPGPVQVVLTFADFAVWMLSQGKLTDAEIATMSQDMQDVINARRP